MAESGAQGERRILVTNRWFPAGIRAIDRFRDQVESASGNRPSRSEVIRTAVSIVMTNDNTRRALLERLCRPRAF